jgi:ubiquinone/menaquinone biosynthesis C-methylase UbiE/glycosyltransferase involved in cell wall biosynthesis
MTPRQWVFFLESVPFTKGAIIGQTSLGGSESAALGMMRALAARGHDVQCFATRLDAPGNYDGVTWHRAESDLGPALSFMTPDVFVALRMVTPFVKFRVPGALNVLWCEDLLVDLAVTGTLSQVDELWYVSAYHRAQWEGREPFLAPLGWVTRNGIDRSLMPAQAWPGGAAWRDGVIVTRDPHRYIYASRPERALTPLLEMWPEIRRTDPLATLGICRYRSMYDGEGTQVQQMVDAFDRMTQVVAEEVGGVEWLGQLGKRQLYEAIAGCRAMLYPGIATFAETSGIVALESQMCGTPLIGSWRGALPETLHPEAGLLIEGDADTPVYRAAFLASVQHAASLPDADYQHMQDAGRRHATGYDFAAIAGEWEQHVEAFFGSRYAANKPKVLRTLLHYDQHVMARDVARELGDTATVDLCDTVIRGEHQTAEDYAEHAIPEVLEEAKTNTRFQDIIAQLKERGVSPARCLDVACGNGSLAIALAWACPEAQIVGVDYSPGVLDMARAAAIEAGVSGRVTFAQSDWQHLPPGPFDLVTCGEFIEHVEQPHQLLTALEAVCAPDGLCFVTCPCGPFAELMERPGERKRGHLHAYTHQQLSRLFVGRQWHLRHLAIGTTQRGVPVGYWIVRWTPNPEILFVALDCAADMLTTRPYQQITAIMIMKDGEDWLRKCLGALYSVDQVLIHDTGSRDGSAALARDIGAQVVETDWPDSFAVARNRVLAQAESDGADWVLWVDCDEVLEHAERLRRYTTGAGPFLGYVIRQQHLMVDAPNFHDKPVRLFRAGRGIRFFGAIHEQPETAPDAGIWPSLELPDVDILHLGYHRDRARREKLLTRNLPLLQQQLVAPEGERRRLDIVLFVRDCANIAQFDLEAHGGQTTDKAHRHARAGVAAYRKHFADPADKYHGLARPFYETCLRVMGQGFEVGWALGAGVPKLTGKLAPEVLQVFDVDEARVELHARMNSILAPLTGPVIDTAPCVRRTGHGRVE